MRIVRSYSAIVLHPVGTVESVGSDRWIQCPSDGATANSGEHYNNTRPGLTAFSMAIGTDIERTELTVCLLGPLVAEVVT